MWLNCHIKGKQPCSRRCSKCGYDECFNGTLFHKLKFDILKALGCFAIVTKSKKVSKYFFFSRNVCFKSKDHMGVSPKVQLAMKSSEQYPLEGEVHLDEFEIGTFTKGRTR